MRVVLTFFTAFLFLLPFSYSQPDVIATGEGGVRPINCGERDNFSTEGQGNNFTTNSFTPAPAIEALYQGEDVLYRFDLTEETDVRLTIESDCPKGTFLYYFDGEGERRLIQFDELNRSKKSFLGAVRLCVGTYYFVIDELAGVACGDYSVSLGCTPFEYHAVCEIGSTVTHCGKTLADTLPPIREDVGFRGSCEVENNPTVKIVEGCPDKSFKVYQAYFRNPQSITGILTNKVGNSEVQVFMEDCACITDIKCFDSECGSEKDPLQSTLNTPMEGFYYFLVTGDPGASYDLQVLANDCDCKYETIPIECGETVTANASHFPNNFDNILGKGKEPYIKCYGRDRVYNGGDAIFEFEVETASKVTIELSSFFEAGIFLFDANCGDNCLAYNETFGLRGTTSIDSFHIECGVYQIAVDMAKPHSELIDCPFTLTLFCEDAPRTQLIEILDATEETHKVEIREKVLYNSSKLIRAGELLTFFANADDCMNSDVTTYVAQNNNGRDTLYGSPNSPKLYYFEGEDIRLRYDDNTGSRFVDPELEGKRTFEIDSTSTLESISSDNTKEGKSVFAEVEDLEQQLSSLGGILEYNIHSNSSANQSFKEMWCLDFDKQNPSNDPVNIVTKLPLFGVGNEKVKLLYTSNFSKDPREINLQLTAVNNEDFNESTVGFTLRQNGIFQCTDGNDQLSPRFKENVCGDTVDLTIPGFELNERIFVDWLIDADTLRDKVLDNCTTNPEDFRFALINNLRFPLPQGYHSVLVKAIDLQDNEGNSCEVIVHKTFNDVDRRNAFIEKFAFFEEEIGGFSFENCIDEKVISVYEKEIRGRKTQYFHLKNRDEVYRLEINRFEKICDNNASRCLLSLQIDDEYLIDQFICQGAAQGRANVLSNNTLIFNEYPDLLVSPNPNRGVFEAVIHPFNTNLHQLTIMNSLGQIINEVNFSPKNTKERIKLDLTQYTDGVFFIQLKANKETITKKMMITGE